MPSSLTIAAPAKINLWLRILRRRDDGFHELDTRLLALDLADELTLRWAGAGEAGHLLTCSDPALPVGADNLVLKALAAMEKRTGPLPGLAIHLEKRIPHGAGLGGGSSDAAALLRGVNELAALGFSQEELAGIAAEVGSDVPFFVHGGACDVRGRGEVVEPLPSFAPRLRVLLLKPDFPVSTPWAYRQWLDSREIPGIPYAAQRLPFGEVVNDLERPVFAKYLLLADMKAWLLVRAEIAAALMSGSGSTMFALVREEAETGSLLADVAAEYGPRLWTWLGRTH